MPRPWFPKFRGRFKSFSVSISTNREQGTDSRLLVYSQGSRAVVLRYLWIKYLWDELSKDEMKLFLSMSEVINSDIIYGALRATLKIGKDLLRQRLQNCPFLPQDLPYTIRQYHGYKRIDVEIHEFTRSLPKVPKYSGYVRSSSRVGSKSSRGASFLDPLDINEDDYADNKFDWYIYLTVDDRFLLSQ